MSHKRLLERLPDHPYAWPGREAPLRTFSRAHLRAQNRRASSPDGSLVRELRTLAERDRAAANRLEDHVDALANALADEQPADLYTIATLIRRGHLLGLSSPWGVAPDADLLWAACARALDHHGADHVNDALDDVRRNAAEAAS